LLRDSGELSRPAGRARRRPTRPAAAADVPPLDTDLCRVDRLAGLGELVAEVAHEVRNALGVLQSFLALLPERAGDPEFRASFAGVGGEELARLERLLDLLLAQASPADAAQECAAGADVGEAIAAVAQLVGHRAAVAGVRLELDAAEKLPSAAIAPDALRQVLLNLALNALGASPAGGDVRIAARPLGRAVEICVEDRGPGVPRGLRRRVFEPFFTTRTDRPGGLGLAISRGLVAEAGGTLAVADRAGGGSRFRIRLPVRGGD